MSSREFDLNDPCIKVTTLHAAKGLEFPVVVIAHGEAGRLPRESAATDPDEVEGVGQVSIADFRVKNFKDTDALESPAWTGRSPSPS